MNDIQPEFQKKFSNRVVVALFLTLLAIPAIIIGNWLIVLFALVGLLFATHEILTVRTEQNYPLPIRIFVYLMMVGMIFYIFVENNLTNFGINFNQWSFATGLNQLELPTFLLTVLVATLFFSSITDVRFKVQDATYLITMAIILSLSFQAFLFLRFYPEFIFNESRSLIANSFLLLYAAMGTFFTDIGAYLIGTFFGKHKMNIRVSKNKTWEGFAGGVGVSFLGSFTFGMVLAFMGTPLLPFLTLNQWYWILLMSMAMPLIATLGDFTFSIIKREFGIKNFSNILGEHGGILDRVDSFSMVVLVVALIISLISNFFYSVPI
jgi:phosphatidate cytidylyltransferase